MKKWVVTYYKDRQPQNVAPAGFPLVAALSFGGKGGDMNIMP